MKTGRPREAITKSAKFSLRLSKETEAMLMSYCNRHNINRSEAIRRAIELLAKGVR